MGLWRTCVRAICLRCRDAPPNRRAQEIASTAGVVLPTSLKHAAISWSTAKYVLHPVAIDGHHNTDNVIV